MFQNEEYQPMAESVQHRIMSDDPNVAPAVRTADPHKLAIVYKAEIRLMSHQQSFQRQRSISLFMLFNKL